MVNPITSNTNLKSSNKTDIAIVAGGTVLGAGGGRLALKAAGYDKFVKDKLVKLSNEVKETVEAGKAELKDKYFQEAGSNDKYSNLIATKKLSGQEFGKDFQLSDFLDAQDMKRYDDELSKFLAEADDVTKKGTAAIKGTAFKKALKWTGVGAAIGLVIGALIVGIKLHLNKKQNNKIENANQ